MVAKEKMGNLAEEAVEATLALGRRVDVALRDKAKLGIWLETKDAAIDFQLSPELVDFALANAEGASPGDVANKLAFLILSTQADSAIDKLIGGVAAKTFRHTGAALAPYMDADDLRSMLRWKLWKLDVAYFSSTRILRHPGLAAYVSVIARRIVIDEIRSFASRSRVAEAADDLERAVDPRESIESVLDDLDVLRRLSSELPQWQQPIIGVLSGDLDRNDALSAINHARESDGLAAWTPDSLRTALHRARDQLRSFLDERSEAAPIGQKPSPASVQNAPLHAWRRFWGRFEQPYLEDGGFLVDPEGKYGRSLQPNAFALDRLDDAPCLVLLGEPGIGKSTTLQQEVERLSGSGRAVTFVDLSRVSTLGALQVAIQPALRASSPLSFLVLDGLDEGLARNPALASELPLALHGIDRTRTRLRISCRTLEWPAALSSALRAQWGTEAVEIYELLPLRLEDVSHAAANHELDADAFVACIREREVVSLAIRPISLRFLLEVYAKDGTLPRSKAHLFDEGTLVLCSEEGTWQRGRGRGNPDVFRRRAIAARLAALTTFTNSQAIERATTPSSGALPTRAVVGGTETTNSATYQVDASALEDVLTGTALFTARTATSFGWSHQSYREFLTAWYLAQHDVGAEVAVSLYFPSQRSRVPQPLREVAAWHATLVPVVFDLLLERDPEVLLHSDGGATSDQAKAQLTESLLARMANYEATDSAYYARHYRRLKHPGLAAQLRRYIADKEANIIVRRSAMDIAWSCEVVDVTNNLLIVLQDSTEDLYARECAARALGQLGGEVVLEFFLRSLDGDFTKDLNDEIRGNILEYLWPAHLDAPSLFEAMPAPKRGDYTGTYQRFIDSLPASLRNEDVACAISWVEHVGDGDYHLERAEQRIIDLALKNLHRREVLEPLCRLIRASLTSRLGPWSTSRRGRDEERAELSTADRRRILAELVRTAHSDPHLGFGLMFSKPALLAAEDVEWLARSGSSSSSDDIARGYGTLVARLYQQFGYPTDVRVLDSVLTVSSSAFREPLKGFLDPVELTSDTAQSLREWWNASQGALHSEEPEQGDVDDEKQERWPVIVAYLEKVEAGASDSWISFVSEWTHRHPRSVREVPEWGGLSPDKRERILSAAIHFLNKATPPDLVWLDTKGTFPWASIAARLAFELAHDAGDASLNRISEDGWKQWCASLVGVSFPEMSENANRELFQRFNAHAAQEINSAIVRVMRRDNDDDTAGFVLRELPQPISEALQAAILPLLDELKDRGFEDALETLVAGGSTVALARGAREVESSSSPRAARAARVVLSRRPDLWPQVITRMQHDRPFTETLASLLDDDHPRTPLDTLNEQRTAELFVTLFRLAPPVPRRGRRGGLVTARHHLSWLRDRMIRKLVDYGTDDAIAALEWVIAQLPDHHELRWHLVSAREKHADATWKPLSPSEFWPTIRVAMSSPGEGAFPCTVVAQDSSRIQHIADQLRTAIPGLRLNVSDQLLIGGTPEALAQLCEFVETTPSLRDEVLSVRLGDEWMFERVPESRFTKRTIRDASHDEMVVLLKDVHVLVETATDLETRAVLHAMDPLPHEASLVVGSLDGGTYTIGRLGNYAVAHLQSDMSAEGPNGAPLATADALREVEPRVVLLVGIAFGISRSKQRLGDVLVAEHITSYELVKLRPDRIDERGETLHGNTILCERVKAHKRTWEYFRADGSQVDVHVGRVLSGAKLVNNREFRDGLARRFLGALGGEMEGSGGYAAAFRRNVPILLLKGICDWADGLKNDRAQPFAAAAAVALLRYVLGKPDSLRALEIPTVEDTPSASAFLIAAHRDKLQRRWAAHRPLGLLSGRTTWSSALRSEDLFVPPRIRRRGAVVDATVTRSGHELHVESEDRAELVIDRLVSGSSIALVGNVGSGKSTLLMWCAAQLAGRSMPGQDAVPLLLHARDVRDHSWADILKREFPTAHSSVAASRWYLLVDGVDEVGIAVWSSLARLRNEQPTIVGIVGASRSSVLPGDDDGFEVLELSPWSQTDLERFLVQWGRHDEAAVERVRTQLGGRPSIDLLSNPLTATAALLVATDGRALPQSRAGIIGCVVEMLFQAWRRERDGSSPTWADVRPALVELATRSLRGDTLSIEDLRRTLAARGYSAAIDLTDEIERQLGVLVRRDDRHVDFVLRTVAEYLVGEAARSEPWDVLEQYSRTSWGHEVVRHAVGISADQSEPRHANELLQRLYKAGQSPLTNVSDLRVQLSAIDATADLSSLSGALAPDTIEMFGDVFTPLLLEEISTWVGAVIAERVRRVVQIGGAASSSLLSRTLMTFGPTQADPALWYSQADFTVEEWIGTLLHRDANVRAIAVDRLGKHLERQDVRHALLIAITDEGHDSGSAPPSVRAGLLWRTVPRGPDTRDAVRHLGTIVDSLGQFTAGAAALALLPTEAPVRDLARALMWLSHACYVPRSVVDELRAVAGGASAVDEVWPDWKNRVNDGLDRTLYGTLESGVVLPPPSAVVRNRVVHAFGPRLGELDLETFAVLRARVSMAAAKELVATGHVERALQRFAGDVPLDSQLSLGALLLSSQDARTQVLGLWPPKEGRLYPGIALEPLIEIGDIDAARIYAEWLPDSPYHWGILLRAPMQAVLEHPLILPVARRLVLEVIDRAHVRQPDGSRLAVSAAAVVLWNFASAWRSDASLVERVWSIVETDQTEALRGLLVATDGVPLDSVHLEDLHARVRTSLEETCPVEGGPVDGLRAVRAEREVMWLEERGFAVRSKDLLQRVARLQHPAGWLALAALWPVLNERERVRASQSVARDAIDAPFVTLPTSHIERFVRVAPDYWCNELIRVIEGGGSLEGSIAARTLSLLPRALQLRVAQVLRDSRRLGLELPWRSAGEVARYARTADTARKILFELGE